MVLTVMVRVRCGGVGVWGVVGWGHCACLTGYTLDADGSNCNGKSQVWRGGGTVHV